MTFAVGVALRRPRALGGVAFGAALLGVVPTAEGLEVVEFVAAAVGMGLDVVDLIRGFAAMDAARVPRLAAVAIASENADAAELPVGGEFVTAL